MGSQSMNQPKKTELKQKLVRYKQSRHINQWMEKVILDEPV